MRRSPFFALSLLALGAILPVACTQDFNIFANNGGGGTGGTTTTTTSGGGGVGGCTADSDCNDTNQCTTDTCNKATGKCTNTPVADGPVAGMNTTGDCKLIQCTDGKLESVADDTDKPADNDPCVVIDCNNGNVSTTDEPSGTSCGPAPQACDGMGNCVGCMMDQDCPAVGDCQQRNCDQQNVCSPIDRAAGSPCSSNGGSVCDGSGTCVECVNDGDCNGPIEICNGSHQCVSSCGDGMENGNETDVDCGGPCPDCGTGKKCNDDGDCSSGVCTQQPGPNTCAAPACNDNVRNGSETDTDCGGATCPKCANGDTCMMPSDCTSGFCVGMVCVDACHNTVKDGSESDVDCGGSAALCSTRCGNGKNCTAGTDCTSNYCNPSGKCATPTCSDMLKNQGESDVDCGGPNCPDCADGKTCTVPGDCVSNRCTSGTCTSCSDMAKNGTETDVDCGGTCTTKCANGKDCLVNADCTSGYCNASNKCAAPACNDLAQNGTETDVDCGGSCGATCTAGKTCATTADCLSPLTCNPTQHTCQ